MKTKKLTVYVGKRKKLQFNLKDHTARAMDGQLSLSHMIYGTLEIFMKSICD